MPQTLDKPQTEEKELHVGLEIPNHSARQIHNWALNQSWPEGTEFEHQKDYHITLLYSNEGHEHKDDWWIEHLDTAEVRIKSVTAFPARHKTEGGYAYVLLIDSPEIDAKAAEMQGRAEGAGLPINKFPGGYKAHMTVAYGPSSRLTGIKPPNFQFDVGPSSVSPSRPKTSALELIASEAPEPPYYRPSTGSKHCGNCKMYDAGSCWGYGNKHVNEDAVCNSWASETHRSAYEPNGVEIVDHLSLTNVAANLHYKFAQGGLDAGGATEYARKLLKLIGYPDDELTLQAAIQAWQQTYPQDRLIEPAVQSQAIEAPATTPTESWGYGTHSAWSFGKIEGSHRGLSQILSKTIPERISRVAAIIANAKPLYHWVDASEIHDWLDESHTGPGQTYLTETGDDPSVNWNPDVPHMENPVRITIDSTKLDPMYFDQQYGGWLGNHRYQGAIPPDAIEDIKAFKRPEEWDEDLSTVPTAVNNPDDHWPEFGDTPPDHNRDLQFSNDWNYK